MSTLQNPYVGPRAFTSEDPGKGRVLYGRDRELQELLQLFTAERIVLLYSPSGAGKTSLIQAALVPALKEENFHVLPIMRVSHEAASPDIQKVPGFNRYVFSSLLSLEEARPEGEQTPEHELAAMKLEDYLKVYNARLKDTDLESQPLVLIFDQFEEILTADLTDYAAKEEFFRQVGTALRDPQRWGLISMREDYVATLDPFMRFIPTALSTTFRLDLLCERPARLAIRMPAKSKGVVFEREAAAALVNDLSMTYVRQLGGKTEKQPGPYIDPVQLQVVCYRLWEKLPVTGATRTITAADLQSGGDVTGALAGYYEDRLKETAAKGYASERDIRNWVDKNLITRQGVRGQVIREEGASQGLDNRAIDELIKAHLLRSEKRRNETWIELAHDRLLEPVQRSNRKYRDTLSTLQQKAEEWHERNRAPGYLLRDEALKEAEDWAEKWPGELMQTDREFLATSRKARAHAKAQVVLTRTIGALGIIALVGVGFALYYYKKAEDMNKRLDAATSQLYKLYKMSSGDSSTSEQVDIEQIEQILKANDEYHKVVETIRGSDKKHIKIHYYYKEGDSPKVEEELGKLQFTVENVDRRVGLIDTPTNYLRYGQGVNAEDVRLVALALLRAGVQLKAVGCVAKPASKPMIIEIGAHKALENETKILTVDDLDAQIVPCQIAPGGAVNNGGNTQPAALAPEGR